MTKNEIVGRLRDGGLDASSTNRSAAVYVADAREGRAAPGWFEYRIVCDSEATERRARAILSRWYDIETSGNVWRLRSRNRVPLMAIKRGSTPPTPPTPTVDYMYFEAAEANSTVSLMSTLPTAPDLEYSTDGVTWQEWQHTTADGLHTFDTLTLTAIGDRVYLRGDNPNGFADVENEMFSIISMSGKINSGGNIMSILDSTMSSTTVPQSGFAFLFGDITQGSNPNTTLLTPPDMSSIVNIDMYSFYGMFYGCVALQESPTMPLLTLPLNYTDEDIEVLMMSMFYMFNGSVFQTTINNNTLTLLPNILNPVELEGELIYHFNFAAFTGNTSGYNIAEFVRPENPEGGDFEVTSISVGSRQDETVWIPTGETVQVTMTAEPFDNYTFEKWQSSVDGDTWTDIPGATSIDYTVSVSEAGNYYYKAVFVSN